MSTSLLRQRFPASDVRCLPFVRGKRKRSFWRPADAFPNYTPSEQGSLCAAAYLTRQQMLGPSHGLLATIIAHMPRRHTACEIYFFRFVEFAQHRSLTGCRPLNFEVYAQKRIEAERATAALMPTTIEGPEPSYIEALAMATVLRCTALDLALGDVAYLGGAR